MRSEEIANESAANKYSTDQLLSAFKLLDAINSFAYDYTPPEMMKRIEQKIIKASIDNLLEIFPLDEAAKSAQQLE